MKDIEIFCKAIADCNRLRILKLLEARKMCVCELSFVLGITQPSVSRHLGKLKSAGLISCEQDGFWTNYYLLPEKKCSQRLLIEISRYLNDDAIIGRDLKKIKMADRKKLCCKNSYFVLERRRHGKSK